MLRNIITIYLSLFCLFSNAQSTASLVEVPAEVFVNKGLTTFDSILTVNDQIEKEVRALYNLKVLSHELTADNSDFEKYWEAFGNQWFWVKLKPDMPLFLIFKGMISFGDEKEYVELYDINKNSRIFLNSGKLLAYKKHQLTGEIMLYVHDYPCCQSASHNIICVRYVNGDIRTKKRFFVGRDSNDMVGPFFPEKVNHTKEYKQLDSKTTIRWSPAIVNNNAFLGRAKSNVIIHYTEGAIYKVLYENNNWKFVILFNGIAKEKSSVLNYTNFINRPVYGWIKK